jgi:hypothetical protein
MQQAAGISESELATTSELARESRRSEGSIRQLARQGRLPVTAILGSGMRVFDRRMAMQVLETLTRRASREK